jgi:hypothetical protein
MKGNAAQKLSSEMLINECDALTATFVDVQEVKEQLAKRKPKTLKLKTRKGLCIQILGKQSQRYHQQRPRMWPFAGLGPASL